MSCHVVALLSGILALYNCRLALRLLSFLYFSQFLLTTLVSMAWIFHIDSPTNSIVFPYKFKRRLQFQIFLRFLFHLFFYLPRLLSRTSYLQSVLLSLLPFSICDSHSNVSTGLNPNYHLCFLFLSWGLFVYFYPRRNTVLMFFHSDVYIFCSFSILISVYLKIRC